MSALGAAFAAMAFSAEFSVGFFDELSELYPDSVFRSVPARTMTVETPRGSYAGVHLLLNDLTPGQAIEFSDNGGNGVWYRLVDVPVEVNSGTDGWTERANGKVNPHVVRRAPFQIFDALLPIARPFTPTGTTAAVRYELRIPTDAVPGPQSVRLTVRHAGASKELTFHIDVRSAVVPPIGRESAGFTNWWSEGNVAKYHGVAPWSEAYWRMLEKYADLMARSRQNTILVPWASFVERKGSAFILDRVKLRRFVDLFSNRGIYWLEGGHFAGREDGVWEAKRFTLNLTKSPVNDLKGKEELRAIASELYRVIVAEGWKGRWMQHLADEPIDVNVEDYAQMAQQVKQLMPGVPIFEATMSTRLVGAVDGWCPKIHEFQHARAWFGERQAAGNQVWVYTCLDPTGPWLNRLLDMERLRPVYVGWAVAKYELDGFLHWGFNFWRDDPFSQSVEPDVQWSLPAGDTHVAYPTKGGPVSSTRLEAQRIGFEDAELLREVKKKDPRRYEQILNRVFRAADEYEKDVGQYRMARKALLNALER